MKKLILLFSLSIFLFSCGDGEKNRENNIYNKNGRNPILYPDWNATKPSMDTFDIKSSNDKVLSLLKKMNEETEKEETEKTLQKKIKSINEYSMDELTESFLKSKNVDEGVKDFLRAFRSGDLSKYSIDELEGFISLIRRNADAAAPSDAKTLILKYCDHLEEMINNEKK